MSVMWALVIAPNTGVASYWPRTGSHSAGIQHTWEPQRRLSAVQVPSRAGIYVVPSQKVSPTLGLFGGGGSSSPTGHGPRFVVQGKLCHRLAALLFRALSAADGSKKFTNQAPSCCSSDSVGGVPRISMVAGR